MWNYHCLSFFPLSQETKRENREAKRELAPLCEDLTERIDQCEQLSTCYPHENTPKSDKNAFLLFKYFWICFIGLYEQYVCKCIPEYLIRLTSNTLFRTKSSMISLSSSFDDHHLMMVPFVKSDPNMVFVPAPVD